MEYSKATRYPDLAKAYDECSGPGALKLAEFIADKLAIDSGDLVLDIGAHKAYQTCFLAKEYGVFVVGIDPGLGDNLSRQARSWAVQDRVLGSAVGVPDTRFRDSGCGARPRCVALVGGVLSPGMQCRGSGSHPQRRRALDQLRIRHRQETRGANNVSHLTVEARGTTCARPSLANCQLRECTGQVEVWRSCGID